MPLGSEALPNNAPLPCCWWTGVGKLKYLNMINTSGGRTGTTGGGNQAHGHGTTLAGHLGGHGMGLANLVSPVAAADGDDGHLGCNDRAANRGRHLHTESCKVCLLSSSCKVCNYSSSEISLL